MLNLLDDQQTELWSCRFRGLRNNPATRVSFAEFAEDHPLITLSRYWNDRIAQDDHIIEDLPVFRHFRPADFRDLIKWLLLLGEVNERTESRSFSVRIAGTAVEAMFDRVLKGLTLEELFDATILANRKNLIETAIAECIPVSARIWGTDDVPQEAALDLGIFPFICDLTNQPRILLAAIPCRRSLRRFL